jgi:hypothetical protein
LSLRMRRVLDDSDEATSTDGEQSSIAGKSSVTLSTAESSERLAKVAPLASADLGSMDSTKHDQGLCKPCLFVHTHVGCQNGTSCEFCHFHHKRKSKARPCKGKRDRYRKLLMRMEDQSKPIDDDNESSCDNSELPQPTLVDL